MASRKRERPVFFSTLLACFSGDSRRLCHKMGRCDKGFKEKNGQNLVVFKYTK